MRTLPTIIGIVVMYCAFAILLGWLIAGGDE